MGPDTRGITARRTRLEWRRLHAGTHTGARGQCCHLCAPCRRCAFAARCCALTQQGGALTSLSPLTLYLSLSLLNVCVLRRRRRRRRRWVQPESDRSSRLSFMLRAALRCAHTRLAEPRSWKPARAPSRSPLRAPLSFSLIFLYFCRAPAGCTTAVAFAGNGNVFCGESHLPGAAPGGSDARDTRLIS